MTKNITKQIFTISLALILTIILPVVSAIDPFTLYIQEDIDTNSEENLITNKDYIYLTWNKPANTTGDITYEVFKGSGLESIASDIYTTHYKVTIDNYAEGNYDFMVTATDSNDSSDSTTVSLTIDREPTSAVDSITLTDGTTDIINKDSNSDIVYLAWKAPTNAVNFKLYYKIDNNIATEITNYSDVSITGTQAEVNIGSDGLNLVDGNITFQISALDEANNESEISEVSFNYDTKSPRPINNLIMKESASVGQAFPVDSFINKDTSVYINWSKPYGEDVFKYIIYVKQDDEDYIEYVTTDVTNSIVYNTELIDKHNFTDGKISIKITTIDDAGNESAGVEVYYNLDTVNPDFSISYEIGGNGAITDIDTKKINYSEKSSIVVVNENNDIASYSITSAGSSDNYKDGNAEDLENAIKKVDSDGLYFIKVKDLAGNKSIIEFTFDQIYPELPDNKYLDVSSVDVEYREGVQADITIEWEKSSDPSLDHYEIWLNGELYIDNIENPTSGDIVSESFTITTIRYGDVIHYYEVRLFDDAGNYGSYYEKKHITTDLAKPTAEIVSTQSTDEEIIFEVDLKDPNRVIDSVYAKLYKNDEYIKKISISTGLNEYSFSGLDSGETDYSIKIQAYYDFNGSEYNDVVLNPDTVYNIDTLSRSHDVKAEIISASTSDNSVDVAVKLTKYDKYDETAEVGIYDENGSLIDSQTIELDTDELETSININFNDLLVGHLYQIRVDETDILATYNFFTEKDIPTAYYKIVEIDQSSISLNIIVEDDDNSSTSLNVILLEDGKIVPNKIQELSIGSNNITFSGLEGNTEYEYKVYASYDIGNDRGIVKDDLIKSFEVYTAKQVPSVQFKNIEVTGNSIEFDSDIDDEDYSIKSVKAVLYKGTESTGEEVLLNVGLLKNREFDGLDPLTEYRINIEIEYDLNDSTGTIKNILFYGVDFTTLKTLPTVEPLGIKSTNKSAEFTAKITDPTGSYLGGFVKLYSLDSAVPLQMYSFYSGEDKIFTFTELKPDTTYIIKVDADINLGGEDGDDDIFIYTKEFKTEKNLDADIGDISKNTNSITAEIDIINYIDEDISTLLLLDGEIIKEYNLDHGSNDVTFTQLSEGTNYELRIIYSNSKILKSMDILTEEITSLKIPEIFITQTDINENGSVFLKVNVSDIDDTLTSDRVTIKICNEEELCTIQEIGLSILASGLNVQLPYEENYISVSMDYDNIESIGKITDTTDKIIKPEEEPIDEEEPTPEIPKPVEQPKFVLTEVMVISIAVVLSVLIVTIGMLIIYSKKSKY